MNRPHLDLEPRIPPAIAALPNLNELPRYADRRQLAALHTLYFGPLSPRSLEVWPLDWRIVNNRAVASVAEFWNEAQRRFDAAPRPNAPRAATAAKTRQAQEPTETASDQLALTLD